MTRYQPLSQTNTALSVSTKDAFPLQDIISSNIYSHRFIKLFDQSLATVDLVDSLNEDPFMLESFEDLIKAHFEQDKEFILARAITVDPINPLKLYYSYYSAHHLNKVDFCIICLCQGTLSSTTRAFIATQDAIKECTIKQLSTFDYKPLNNMQIEGDVEYYTIRKHSQEVNERIKSPLETMAAKLKGAFQSLFSSKTDSPFKQHTSAPQTTVDSEIPLIEDVKVSKSVRRNSAVDVLSPLCRETHRLSVNTRDNSYLNQRTHNESIQSWISHSTSSSPITSTAPRTKSSPQRRSPRKLKSPSSTIIQIHSPIVSFYTATFYATCDDYLMKSSVRKFFKENALSSEEQKLFHLEPAITTTNHIEGDAFAQGMSRIIKGTLLKSLIIGYVAAGVLITAFAGSCFFYMMTASS